MKTGFKSALAAALFGIAFAAGAAQAAERQIGVATYEFRPNRDIIQIGEKAGMFKSLRLEVRGSDVEVQDLKVVYGNGAVEEIKVRQVFRAGTSSRDIALSGGKRFIKQIEVTYLANKPAKIVFFGTEAAGAPQPAGWDRQACTEVGFGIDHDVVKVGRKDGMFSALRLSVRKAPIEVFGLRVTFGNGKRQELQVRSVIPDGGQTRPIDLTGGQRGISTIELLYRSIPTFKGKSEVCIDGLQG